MGERLNLGMLQVISNLDYSVVCSFLFTERNDNKKKSLQNLYLGELIYLGCVSVSCFSPSFSEKSGKASEQGSLPADSCLSPSHGNGARNSHWHRPTSITSKSLPLAFALANLLMSSPKSS